MRTLEQVKRPSAETLERLKRLETQHRGMIAAVEPDSGDYFLGKTLVEAAKLAKQGHPGKTFYFIRIGYPFAHEHRGGIRKA